MLFNYFSHRRKNGAGFAALEKSRGILKVDSYPKHRSKVWYGTGKIRAVKGFTLVELVVVVSIFALISGVVLVAYSTFRGTILLENLAYEVAISVREAQSFGLGVRQFEGSFDVAYGIHFDDSSNNTYILFADRDRDGMYDGSGELVRLLTLRKGYSIASFCGVLGGLSERCGPAEITFLDIVYDRPEPDALFTSNLGETYEAARITIASPRGEVRTVTARTTGQIEVEQP